MKNPSKNPYQKKTLESKIWSQGYDYGLSNSLNKTHVDCPVQSLKAKEIQLIWDKGFVAGRKDQKAIPEGLYCYKPLGIGKDKDGKNFMKIKPCPFLGRRKVSDKDKSTIGTMGFCRLTRVVDDILLSDQCKVCGVKDGYDSAG